jgi:hypothetical protein
VNAIYRITVDHDPTQPDYLRFTGKVHRVSDDQYMSGSTKCGETAGEVIDYCRAWIRSLGEKIDTLTVYTDEDGDVLGSADLSLVREYAPDTDEYPTVAS